VKNSEKTNDVTCFLLYSERKLQGTEYPHNLYIQNYSTATSTCLAVRKWLFCLSRELSLASDDQATTFIFWQAVDDVNRGHIRADDRLYQLKALQDASRKNEVTNCHNQLSFTCLGSSTGK
jgi:sorting nexin-27